MTWASPHYFFFLIPLSILFLWIYLIRSRRRTSLKFSHISSFLRIQKSFKSRVASLPKVLMGFSLIFMILALARPQKSDIKQKRHAEGIDILVALDISDSMLIEDMSPHNRLESSKKIINEFIDKRVSDRIGLVVFAGESYTRVPLTLDYPVLKSNLNQVTTSRNIKMGTAIGVALANAVARLKDSTAKSRIIIFLTDGESNSGNIAPETALSIAKGFGIKVYSIGMGRDGMAQLPVQVIGPGGVKTKSYRPLHSKVNVELLKKMADETKGKFFRATTTEALKGIFNEINSLEKSKVEVSTFTLYKEFFVHFAWWAFGFYVLALFLESTWLRRFP